MAVGYRSLAGFPLGAGVTNAPTVGFTSLFWWMGGVGAAAPAAELQRGGWLSDEQIRASDEHRKKRKARERELEETIELAYKRLTGKISAKKIIEPTKGEPEKLSELGHKLAAQLVTKGQDSARLRTCNAQIIADLKRLANEVIEYQEAQAYAMQMEEEAIVMLLLA